jgi:N6-adenosine-specific RNA methylase IME4
MPYKTMTVEEIAEITVAELAEPDCHLWLWTTNQFIEAGFRVMRAWGFQYLAPIHMVKPSGIGNYFVHRTQTVLFGYRQTCRFPLRRYAPTVLEINTNPKRHSEKPDATYELIESISPGPRLEMFARRRRPGWDVWGNEVESDIELEVCA